MAAAAAAAAVAAAAGLANNEDDVTMDAPPAPAEGAEKSKTSTSTTSTKEDGDLEKKKKEATVGSRGNGEYDKVVAALADFPKIVGTEGLGLVSKEGTCVKLSNRSFGSLCGVIAHALEHDVTAEVIKCENVKLPILTHVVAYLEHHKGSFDSAGLPLRPLRSKVIAENVKDPWDAIFVDDVCKAKKSDLVALVLAANYLNIPTLLHLTAATLATYYKGKTIEEVKKMAADDKQQVRSTLPPSLPL